ncbi:MAG: glucosaminidase domain-containing protein, partial [Alphaproteobacteria bacterium]
MTFERGALSLVGGFAVLLVAVASLNPPVAGTAKPSSGVLQRAEALALSNGLSPKQILLAEREAAALNDMNVAAGNPQALTVDAGSSARTLSNTFGRMNYRLDNVVAGSRSVPRMFLVSLPDDLSAVAENHERKQIFFRSVLPLVLQVNDEILADRRRLWRLRYQARLGQKAGPADRLWLQVMSEMYGVKRGDIDSLLTRIDIIPPSLALAQAAEESGWGTSRFVRECNAMFGQWTYSASNGGLIPAER